jgi:hypothetical protein
MKYQANPVIVNAFKIEAIDQPNSNGSRLIRHEEGQMFAHGEMFARINPVIGDYLVVQEDGYVYLNPKAVFERKYSPEVTDKGKISDGYHTFDELYDHRIALWIALCKQLTPGYQEHQSWRTQLHSDGTRFEGWFVLGLKYAAGEQMTYHLPMSRWDECAFARTLERAPEFDGHTSADVLKRIAAIDKD